MVGIGDGVGMEMFKKFAGVIEEIGVDKGVGIATLRGGNGVMVVDTADEKGEDVSNSTIA